MSSRIDQLNIIRDDLNENRPVNSVTIRAFLTWFDVQRRTTRNKQYIDDELSKAGIKTTPDYKNIWVDSVIGFDLATATAGEGADTAGASADTSESSDAEGPEEAPINATDPSHTIGEIDSANITPVRVSPNAGLLEAITLMLTRNFSQLPVMQNDRDVRGVISWESIGARMAAGTKDGTVQDYMDEPHELPLNASLFRAINTIVEHNYVLIRSSDKKICGIVTASDIALRFESISTPFLLIAEIEKHLRNIIDSKLQIADIRNSCAPEYLPASFTSAAELTFGNYVAIFQNAANWSKIGLNLDRAAFCAELGEVNTIRNDVMHFDPDPLSAQELTKLRNISRMLNMLRSIGAF